MRRECRERFSGVFLKLLSQINILSTYYEIGIRWVPQNPIDNQSRLVQVMSWCRYLNQCWLISLSPSGVTVPQWVAKWLSHPLCQYLGRLIQQHPALPISAARVRGVSSYIPWMSDLMMQLYIAENTPVIIDVGEPLVYI